eukprot:scaffold154434_cov22-Tisochrysis_lutea.AAC.1
MGPSTATTAWSTGAASSRLLSLILRCEPTLSPHRHSATDSGLLLSEVPTFPMAIDYPEAAT